MTDTTTEEAVQETGVEETQPVEQQTEAGTPAPEASQQTEGKEPEESDNSEPEFDAKTWLEKKGLDPANPETVLKLAKAQHAAEQKMHQATSEASEIKKSLESQPANKVSTDPLVQQLYERQLAFERNTSISNFKRDVNLTPDQEAKMVSYMADNPEKAQLVNAGYMNLHDLYTLSGAGSADTSTIKAQGKQEALQQLANKQRATAVTGAAQKPGNTQPESDPILDILKGDD